ncbi:hypothetical protein [Pseudobacteriovorax antillogorgiicola]|uniref:Uncharacterized protein n=1 Tax=Pseudobacteriovorax antillogorgiicola TaxID=1513793 RepID=A0A1Y6BBI6_9BACT|nr:hypothetical protein [Pseudobacteriovorax antillogorgiicola]TCS57308.1 hypothetical protein EDD56_10348 [Pseudobacteriovorax antillogorgiicola]SMF02726.1 hypothetical protein SAMN06296036_103285 [Pseudobacteriovorax antillogorgiicola]
MKLIAHLPLFALLLGLFNLVALSPLGDSYSLDQTLVSWQLVSGAALELSLGTVLVMAGVVCLFFELAKATRTSSAAIVDHSLSTLVFVGFLLELLLVPELGHSSFLIVTGLSLLDLVSGFTISIATARRDFAVDRP